MQRFAHERNILLTEGPPIGRNIAFRLPRIAEAWDYTGHARMAQDVIQGDGRQILGRGPEVRLELFKLRLQLRDRLRRKRAAVLADAPG
jgi:hypothetical protein